MILRIVKYEFNIFPQTFAGNEDMEHASAIWPAYTYLTARRSLIPNQEGSNKANVCPNNNVCSHEKTNNLNFFPSALIQPREDKKGTRFHKRFYGFSMSGFVI